jgi:hypothetical protein
MTSEPGGIRVTGKLLNEQAVGHESAQFTISISGVQREFSVMHLPPGAAADFAVSVPGVSADSARYATIAFRQSTVSYNLFR